MAALDDRSHLNVTLNVYDFVKQSDTVSGSLLSLVGCGIHHSGLQIEDRESRAGVEAFEGRGERHAPRP